MKINKVLKIMIGVILLSIIIYMILPKNMSIALTIGDLTGTTAGTSSIPPSTERMRIARLSQ